MKIRRYYGFDKPVHIRVRTVGSGRSSTSTWAFLHLPGPGLGRDQGAVPGIDLPRHDRLSPELTSCACRWGDDAVRHGSRFDFISSVIVFPGVRRCRVGPLGTALLVLFGGGTFWSVFPLGGFRPDNWESLTFGRKIYRTDHYMFCRSSATCGLVATETILMKKLQLMEKWASD